ncbi:MAG: hypothetical protein L0154_20200 [Chloroflexi bacterium]|nr:hypothetical protein [Chloroflexota bacterium]
MRRILFLIGITSFGLNVALLWINIQRRFGRLVGWSRFGWRFRREIRKGVIEIQEIRRLI